MTDQTTAVPRLSWAEVCARRLERHRLATPSPDARPADVVRAMGGAAHVQVMSAAELSIGLRTTGVTRADVRHALWVERSLVKTFGPRGTVHLLPAQDLPTWVGALSATPPPPHSFPEDVRLSPDQTEAVVEAVALALEDAELTVDELTEAVAEHAGPWAGDLVMPAFQGTWPRWRQALHLAGMRGVLCFGPTRGRKVTYTSPRRWLPGFLPAEGFGSLAGVVTGYLQAYGPATPQQFAQWLAAPRQWAAGLFDSLAGELEQVEVDGTRAWVAAGDTAAPPTPPRGVRLLPYFDAYAYAVGNQPRELLYPGRAAERASGNFQVLLVDGVVGGVWQQRRSGRRLDVTVEPLVPLTPGRRRELDEQVGRAGAILQGAPRLTIGTVTTGSHA
jgi:hypothetical protein